MDEDAQYDGPVVAPVPDMSQPRNLYACITCGLVKAAPEWEAGGCENCNPAPMDTHDVADQTTTRFSGVIAIMDPSKSWCAKWIRKKKYVPGLYTLHIHADAVQR